MRLNCLSKLNILSLSAWTGAALLALSAHADIVVDLTHIGNPGNLPDYDHPYGPPYDQRYVGAVDYAYSIGTYEVTVAQYADFLNAKAAADPYGLYSVSMATSPLGPSILRSGSEGSYSYAVVSGKENQPVRWVSFYDGMRLANWMHNGQGDGDTETGSYDLSLGAYAVREPAATWVIPSQDEWYKAAYYKGGSMNAGYWTYATQSDEPPSNSRDGGLNQANYRRAGVFCSTQSGDFRSSEPYLTDVGAFSGSPSPYGTFDQQGNVQEWNDLTGISDPARGLRGGSWYQGLFFLTHRNAASTPTYENGSTGFRVVSPVAEEAQQSQPLTAHSSRSIEDR